MNTKKKKIIYISMWIFLFLTAYIIIYAFHHRDNDGLVYLIFNSYALLAAMLSFGFVLYWQYNSRRRQTSEQKRLRTLVKNISEPAMLWADDMSEAVLNDALIQLGELSDHEQRVEAKFLVPWVFGKKEITEEEIRELVLAKNREYPLTVKSGTPHNVVWNTSSILTDEEGITWFLSIGFDLAGIRQMESDLKAYSKKLAASENRNMLTMELTDVGILLIEQGNKKLFPSDKLQQMIGLPEAEWDIENLRKRVFPIDLDVFDRHVETVRLHMKQCLGHTQVLELRLCGADQQYRWYSYRFKALQIGENGRLVVGGSVIDITTEKEKDAKIEQIAYEDSVTHIPNRNKLMKMGEELYDCTVELGSSYWVIVTDIDRFHLINDTCGYAAGNELLSSFADIMSRQINTAGGFVSRISGDNFAMIIRDSGDPNLPERIMTKIQRTLATRATGALANRALTCSAGYAKMPQDGASFERVLEHAEFALSTGSDIIGSVYSYTKEMHDTIIRENDIEKMLSEAVMNNQLVMYYQPKISLKTGEIMGLEALVRWKKPDGTIVSPGVFIPIAERSLLITHITQFVLYDTCRQIRLWQTMGLPNLVVSINMSSTDFYQENICQQVQNALKHYQLDPKLLEIELTESLALKDQNMTISRMNEMRALGIHIAMDDFGTGYSSLSYIQKLPFTMLKLDQSFVRHMEDDPVVQEIVSSVVRIAKAKQIETIAEGVETPEQARQLRLSGCDYMQGYLASKPLPAGEIEQFIRANANNKIVY